MFPLAAIRYTQVLRKSPDGPVATHAHRSRSDPQPPADLLRVELVPKSQEKDLAVIRIELLEREPNGPLVLLINEIGQQVARRSAGGRCGEAPQRIDLSPRRAHAVHANVACRLKKERGKRTRVRDPPRLERLKGPAERLLGHVFRFGRDAQPPYREQPDSLPKAALRFLR